MGKRERIIRDQRLSTQQAAFLEHLLERYRLYESAVEHHGFGQATLDVWGIHFLRDTEFTRSESASFSRMLRRLEARGLIECLNVAAGGSRGQPGEGPANIGEAPTTLKQFRTTHVKFTAVGRDLAERLTAEQPH